MRAQQQQGDAAADQQQQAHPQQTAEQGQCHGLGQKQQQDLLALAVKEGELRTRSVSRSAQLLASPFWMALVHNNLLASEGSQKLALKPLVELLIDNLFAGTAGDNAAVKRQ